MSLITQRGGANAGHQRPPAPTLELTMSQLLDDIGATGRVPDHLRGEVEALDEDWNRSKRAEEWVVNACIEAGSGDLLVAMLNKHGVERLTGIRSGTGIVVKLLTNCLTLAHIEFSRAAISEEEAKALVDALQACPRLLSLAFRNCEMSNAALSALADGLREMHHLQTLRIEGGSKQWLDKLGPTIADHTTLTSLVLQIVDLGAGAASRLGKTLRRSRTLTMLEVHGPSSNALTSLLEGLASSEGSGIDGGSLRGVEQPGALPRLACIDLRSDTRLDGSFCDALSECIETRKALASVRIRPGVLADEESIARLCSAIENSAAKIDFDAGNVPKALARLAKFRPYQQLILPADAAVKVARLLLKSLSGWGTLPAELQAKIEADLFGHGLLRELRPLLGLMGVSKGVRDVAMRIRSPAHCERFAAPMGRCDLPYEPDLDAFMQFWRLQLSGIDLGESAALLLPEWQLTSKTSSGLSRDQRAFRRQLKKIGEQLVGEQLGWVSRWIEDGNSEVVAFAFTTARRLIKEHNFDLEREAAPLGRRVVLGEVRHRRRLAAAHLARWMFVGTLALAVASHFFDVVMRTLFDQDRAYGIGAPMTLDESFAQRRWVAAWVAWPLVAVFVILLLKVEWVDAITRRLRLPQV